MADTHPTGKVRVESEPELEPEPEPEPEPKPELVGALQARERERQQVWARVSAGCSTARGPVDGAGRFDMYRPTLRNRGSYGGGLLQLPDRPVDLASPWRIRWMLRYEKGEPAVGVVDASIADIDDTAIFYDPSFCGMSCKRGTVWRGDVAVLQASDSARRCAKGTVLRCEVRPDTDPAGPLVFCIERLCEEATGAPTEGQETSVMDGDAIGPEVTNCQDWSIRRLRQWMQRYDPCPHPEPPKIADTNIDGDERTLLVSTVKCAAAWMEHDVDRAQAAAESSSVGEGDWCRLLRIAIDPSLSDWAAACYSAGSFKTTLLAPPELEVLH